MRAALLAVLVAVYATQSFAQTAPKSTDPRVVWWLDPRVPWSQMEQLATSVVVKPGVSVQKFPEPGYKVSGTPDYQLWRGSDPLNSSRKAFRHQITPKQPKYDSYSHRAEITAQWANWGETIIRGVDYWIAFAIKPGADMFGHTNGRISLMDLHNVPDAGDDPGFPPPFAFYSDPGAWQFTSNWNPNNPTRWSQVQNRIGGAGSATVWRETNPQVNTWHKFVIKARFHWDSRQGPYIQIWKATGSGGLVKVASRYGPNAYNDAAVYIPQKFGFYKWDSWGTTTSRTMYTKGYYVLRAASGTPTLDQNSMLALLNQI